MEQGKLTENECDKEKSNFIHYVHERCNKISLLSRHCVVAGTVIILLLIILYCLFLLKCFDTVSWAAGRASGL